MATAIKSPVARRKTWRPRRGKTARKRVQFKADPFLADARVYRGWSPPDTAANHDQLLYGDVRK